jgi:hypothetical protein
LFIDTEGSAVDDDAYKQQVNDAYRAIGRHVVKFSQLVSRMRWLVSWRVALHSTEPYNYAEMLFLEAAAGRISDVFFGLCQIVHKYDPDSDEREVAGKLHAEVGRAVNYRNRLAHGDWCRPLGALAFVTIRTSTADRALRQGSAERLLERLVLLDASPQAFLRDDLYGFATVTLPFDEAVQPLLGRS